MVISLPNKKTVQSLHCAVHLLGFILGHQSDYYQEREAGHGARSFCGVLLLGAKAKSSVCSPNMSGLAAVGETVLVINYAFTDEVLWNWAPKL